MRVTTETKSNLHNENTNKFVNEEIISITPNLIGFNSFFFNFDALSNFQINENSNSCHNSSNFDTYHEKVFYFQTFFFHDFSFM